MTDEEPYQTGRQQILASWAATSEQERIGKGAFHLPLTRDLECRTNTSYASSQDTEFQLRFVASFLAAEEEKEFCLQERSYKICAPSLL